MVEFVVPGLVIAVIFALVAVGGGLVAGVTFYVLVTKLEQWYFDKHFEEEDEDV